MTRVLFVTAEVFGLASTGGLGDVSAALPRALIDLGIDVRVMLPGYPSVLERAGAKGRRVPIGSPADLGEAWLVAARTEDHGVPLLIVDCPTLFDRPGGPYGDERGRDWPDNLQRFALLSHAAEIVSSVRSPLAWSPDLVHTNDWQSGLVPALLATRHEGRPPAIFSIHNMSFLGSFPATTFSSLGLPPQAFGVAGVEFFGGVSLLKAGIFYGDRITTVSPTYAREIRTPQFGCGLDGLLEQRAADVSGILNGVDYERWDPAHDDAIAAVYSADAMQGKRVCKAALQRELGLEVRDDALLLGSVSRLTAQKGLDLLLDSLPWALDGDTQLALLGSGDATLEQGFTAATKRHPRAVGVRIGFDDALAHRIEAGADAFIMPSRFEPCGLNQMYSLRYGTLPIVHRVGGLSDTVRDGVDGFAFAESTVPSLATSIERARKTYAEPAKWREMQRRAMAQDFGWPRAAREYVEAYEKLLPKRKRQKSSGT